MEVLWNTVVTEIKADTDGVNAVTLQETRNAGKRDLSIDGVFIFISL